MNFGGKKLIFLGFIVVLLLGIPITVYLIQQQTEVRSRAEKSTNLSFSPASTQTNPLQKQIGDAIPLDITVDPGKNLVSFIKLEIQYDPDKLATASSNAFQANTVVFPSVLEGPIYSPGKISVTLSVGPDPTKAIQSVVKAATVNFKAIGNTAAGSPTLVQYGVSTQVLSIGTSDQASENVLSTAAPAAIVIGGSGGGAPTTQPIPTGITPTSEPTPTLEPTVEPVPTTNATPTPTVIAGTGVPTEPPVCSQLVADRATTGNAPFSLTLTANGTDSDGTIGKVTFNFGDGQVDTVTTAGGIGTNSVNVSVAHTYNNIGTYQASAILTDSGNAVSDSSTCKLTVTVQSPSGGTGGTGGTGGSDPTPTLASGAATPTMAPSGTFEVAMGVGIFALLLIIGGGFLFFGL